MNQIATLHRRVSLPHECINGPGRRRSHPIRTLFCTSALVIVGVGGWSWATDPDGAPNPERFEALMDEVRKYDYQYNLDGDRDKAVETYREALNWRPNHPDNIEIEFRVAQLLSCSYQLERGDRPRREEGMQVYRHIIASYPPCRMRYWNSLICLAGDYMIEREYRQAWRLYQRLLDERPEEISVHTAEQHGVEMGPEDIEAIKSNARFLQRVAVRHIMEAVYRSDPMDYSANMEAIRTRYTDRWFSGAFDEEKEAIKKRMLHALARAAEGGLFEREALANDLLIPRDSFSSAHVRRESQPVAIAGPFKAPASSHDSEGELNGDAERRNAWLTGCIIASVLCVGLLTARRIVRKGRTAR